jgi:hypothetical protein
MGLLLGTVPEFTLPLEWSGSSSSAGGEPSRAGSWLTRRQWRVSPKSVFLSQATVPYRRASISSSTPPTRMWSGQPREGDLASNGSRINRGATRQPRCGAHASRVRLTDNQEAVGVCRLALICAERTRPAGRFQSSSAPRVLLSPRGEQGELERRRAVTPNYAERLRAGSLPASSLNQRVQGSSP